MDGAATQPRVGIVVLNWHDRRRTEACLAAIGALDYANLFVVLVDNEGDDFGGVQFAPRPQIDYVHSPVNLGFAGGCNLGLRRALDGGAEYVWFLNNDALPAPDSLRHLVAAAVRSDAAIAGAKILRHGSEPPRLDSLAVSVDLHGGRFRLVGHDEPDRGQHDELVAVDAVTGCALLLRADSARRLGGFDERFFLYLEDVDLCLRARAAGAVVVCVPPARVHHDRAAARSGRQSDDSLYYTCRNHFLLLAVHGRGGGPRRAWRNGVILARNLAYAVLDRAGAPRRIGGSVGAVLAGARDYARDQFGPRPTVR